MNETVSQKITQLNTDRVTGITNLTLKGVTAYDTDGFSQIVSKILEIPSDKLTSVRVNNEISYRKQVPSGSAGFCYLNSIGGMTYKSKTYDADTNSGYFNFNVTFDKPITLPSPTVSGATGWIFQPVICGVSSKIPYTNYIAVDGAGYSSYDGIPSGTVISNLYGDSGVPEGLASDVQLKIIPRFESVKNGEGTGEYYYPPDCFTDLRDAKPTAVVSYGANHIPFPYTGAEDMSGKGTLTFTTNADGTVTANGTPTNTCSKTFTASAFCPPPDVYFLSGCPQGGSNNTYCTYLTLSNNGTWVAEFCDKGNGIKVDLTKYTYTKASISMYIFAGVTADNLIWKPMLNSGTSALPYSPYFKKTYTLPTAITGKLGKGCSDTLYDEYSFVDQKAITRVGEGTIDSLTKEVEYSSVRDCFLHPAFSEMRKNGYGDFVMYAQMPFFDFGYSIHQINADARLKYVGTNYGINVCLYVPAGVGADGDAFISWMHSQNIRYVSELETFIEESIALAPTDFDGLIEVEAGGYLEFVNDYGYPVPSTVTFSLINGGGTT